MTSKRRKWVLILLGVIAVAACVAHLTRDREPSYKGKPLSHWIEVYQQEFSNEAAQSPFGHEGADAIRQIGTNALPCLMKWVKFEPSAYRIRYHIGRLLLRLPFVSRSGAIADWIRSEEEMSRAMAAAVSFKPLGIEAAPAIPELTRLMNSPGLPISSSRAVLALGSIGTSAVPVLVKQLADTNALNRAEVARLFIFYPALVTNDTSITPLLVRYLGDPDSRVARVSALALAWKPQLGQPAKKYVISALTGHLGTNTQWDVRMSSLLAVGSYSNQARIAVPILLQAAGEPDERIRNQATNALMRIAPEVLTNPPPQ